MTNLAMVESGPDEVLFRLALTDLSPDEVDTWWATDVRDPAVVRDAIRAGVDPFTAAEYLDVGVTGIDIVRHHRAKITPTIAETLRAGGVEDPVDQRRFIRNNVSARLIAEFSAIGVDDLDVISTYVDAEVDALFVGEIRPERRNDAAAVIEFHRSLPATHRSAHVIAGFGGIGVVSFDDITYFATRGLTAVDVTAFREIRIDDPDVMADYVRHGVSGFEAREFHKAGFASRDTVFRLAAGQVRSLFAAVCARFDITDPDHIIALSARGSSYEITGFLRVGLTDPDDIARVQDLGVDGRDCSTYFGAGFDRLDVATVTALVDANVTPGMAKAYYLYGMRGADAMISLRRAGLSGAQVGRYVRAGTTDPSEIIARWTAGDRP